MDLLKLKTRHEDLHERMNSVEDSEALAALVAELKSCEEERSQQEELVEVLEGEWDDFKQAASDSGRELLSSLIGIVEAEMSQAREAEKQLEKVRHQLEQLSSGAVSAEDMVAGDLRAQLEEKITLVGELEEELVQVSAQLNETNEKLLELEGAQGDGADFLSWKEITSLRDELKQKTELLENYRAERKQNQSSDSSLEEEIANLNSRYQKGRRRITQLLSELEEKNRLLAELTGSAEEIPPPPPVTADEFELPPPIEDEFPNLDDLPVPEGLGELLLKEDTVEDLPAIPYPAEVPELDELESVLSSDPDGSLTEDQDS
jgi:chromosome segregation ATPase